MSSWPDLTFTFTTRGPGETRRLAAGLARLLAGDEIIHLHGGLGTGKTCFVQGLAVGMGVSGTEGAVSPSFTLINEYQGRAPLFHVDLYRLDEPEDVASLGLDDYFGRGVVAIEWAERLPPGYRDRDIEISIRRGRGRERSFEIVGGERVRKRLQAFRDLLPEQSSP